MARSPVGVSSLAIVVKGFFNPAIFSPSWLLGEALIGVPEYEQASVEIIAPELSKFTCGWLAVQVTRDALQYSTQDTPDFERLRDAVLGSLRLLKHTPVGALGINRDTHFAVDSVASWHAIGDALTPKDFWTSLLHLAGMRTVGMMGVRTDKYTGNVNVQVEPSRRIPRGVYVHVNDHYLLGISDHQPVDRDDEAWDISLEADLDPSAKKLPMVAEILTENWDASQLQSTRVIEAVSRLATQA